MGLILLTSYDRMRYYFTDKRGDALTASVSLEQQINGWITSVSQKIANYLGRELEIGSYTQYFDAKYSGVRYWVNAYPITTLTSVYEDRTSQWDGTESELTDNYVGGMNNDQVTLYSPVYHRIPKSIRAIYTGGLTTNGVRSTFVTEEEDVSALDGKYVLGGTTGAFGIVRSTGTNQLVVENLYLKFQAEETLTGYSDYNRTTASGGTATINSITYQSLAESHPAITRAAEIEIRYMWKHKDDFELIGTIRDGTNLRRQENTPGMLLTKEAANLLSPYRKPRID